MPASRKENWLFSARVPCRTLVYFQHLLHIPPRLQQQRCYSQPINDSFTPVTVLLAANQQQFDTSVHAANSQPATTSSAAPPPSPKAGQSATALLQATTLLNSREPSVTMFPQLKMNQSVNALYRESSSNSRASPDLCGQLLSVLCVPYEEDNPSLGELFGVWFEILADGLFSEGGCSPG